MSWDLRTRDDIVIRGIPDDIRPDDPSLRQRVAALREQRGAGQSGESTMTQEQQQALALARARLRLKNKQAGEQIYTVKAPDGSTFKIKGPAGVPDDQLLRVAAGLWDQQRLADPTANTGFVQRFNEGVGKAFSDVGRGAAQLVGKGPNAEEVRETRQRDAPLMGTGGGVAGHIAAFLPAMAIPGANTVAGATAIGSTAAALMPTESTGERLFNMGIGGALSGGTQALAGPIAQRIGERAVSSDARLKLRQSQNAVADETLRRGRDAGYVLPPSALTDSWTVRRLESVAGKTALGQEAAIRNQQITDDLARAAASLRPEQAISKTNLRAARQELAGPYREVSALSPQAAADLSALQQARFDAKLAWKEYGRQGNRNAFHDATAADARVKSLTEGLERHAQQAGRPDLVESLAKARASLAQNHQVQSAMNAGTGSVDASVIGRALDNGAHMSGPLETIGRFQQAYKPYTREASAIPTPGVSKSEALASALLGMTGAAASGSPQGMLAGGLPFLSGPTRSMLLSKPVQDATLTPNYAPGFLTRNAKALADPEVRNRAGMLARALTVPMIPQVIEP